VLLVFISFEEEEAALAAATAAAIISEFISN
jgi:hypothetical protein